MRALIGAFRHGAYTVSMINLLLTLSLFNTTPAQQTAQVRPCVWPNPCVAAPAPAVEVAQFKPCVWPNVCNETPAPVAQVKTCVWPNVCRTEAPVLPLVIEAGDEVAQFTTCVYPRKCGKAS